MTTETELARRLTRMAGATPTRGVDLESVRRTSRQRRARRFALVVVVVVVGFGAALQARGDETDSSDVEVVSDPDLTTTTTTTTTTAQPPLEAMAGIVSPRSIVAPVEPSFLGSGPQFLVPWHDGFLAFGVVNDSLPVPDLDDPAVEALTPQMREVIAASGATTVAEATSALEEAGLLDEATNIVMGDNELMALVVGVTPGQPYARTSTDGVEWVDLAIAEPDVAGFELSRAIQAVSDGTHVVVEYATPLTGAADRVAWTTDLVDWHTVEVPPGPDLQLPPFASTAGEYVRSLSIGPSGWIATTFSPISIDFLSLISAERRAELGEVIATGAAVPDGIEFSGWVEGAQEVVTVVPWSETESDFETIRALETVPTAVWLGTWDGEVELIDPPQSTVIGTDDLYVALDPIGTGVVSVSVDGHEWASRELPAADASVVSAVGVDQGVVFQLAIEDQFALWLTAADVTDWRRIELPEEITGRQLWARDTGRGALLVAANGHIVTMADGRQFVRQSVGGAPSWLVASSNGIDWLAEQASDERLAAEWVAAGFPQTPPAIVGEVVVVPAPETWLVYELG